MDFASNLIAGVLDDVSEYAKKMIGLSIDDIYVNAGFLLINLDLWRKENIEKQILDFLYQHHGNVYHHDQGLINAICKGRKYVLPSHYNVMTNFFVFPYSRFRKKKPFYSELEICKAKEKPIFIHFTAGVTNKPWIEGCKHPLKNLFLYYKAKTSYKDKPLRKDNRKVTLKLLSFLYYHIPFIYYAILYCRSFVKNNL